MTDHDPSSIPDSTDWLATPLRGLSAVESALRCQVCRDFYKTPMLTTCLHTFCSICIRRALANEGKCPLCRAPEQESKLRWNGAMDDVVGAFINTRPAVLDFATAGARESRSSPKRKLEHESPKDTGDDTSRKRLRSSARLNRTRGAEATAEIARQEINLVEDSGDDEYEDNLDDGLVPCPMCNRRMKEWQVFSHLDKCTVGPADPPRSPARELPMSTNFLNPSPRKQQTKFERLPAINYSMLKDQALRKKMSDLGISPGGSRALLERRHREWCTIWNANCDSVKPKSRPQLIRDLEVWERTQGGRATLASRLSQTSASVKDKDFDRGAWAAKHGSSFKDLIASARRGCPPKQGLDKVEGEEKAGDLSVADDGTTEQTVTGDSAHAAGLDIIDNLVDGSTCEQRAIDDSADELELSVIDSMVEGACDQKAIEPGE